MIISCGLVGFPNVGKSSLFNAMTKSNGATVGNFCFCTIEPNKGTIQVFNQAVNDLSIVSQSEKTIFSSIEIVDIAGLIKGASSGNGLGNEFLAHIRGVDVIIHVLRCFKDSLITHAENRIDPKLDLQIIIDELKIADIQFLEKYAVKIKKKPDQEKILNCCTKILTLLQAPNINLRQELLPAEIEIARSLGVLSIKPSLCVCNIDLLSASSNSNSFVEELRESLDSNIPSFAFCIDLEQEISSMNTEERMSLLRDLQLENSQHLGFKNLISTAFNLAGMHSFITSGPKETRAWDIPIGTTAKMAAKKIHEDFFSKFIRAEIASSNDFIANGGWVGCRKIGASRFEGANYVVKSNDVVLFINRN